MKKYSKIIILLLSAFIVSCQDAPEARLSATVETVRGVTITYRSGKRRGRNTNAGNSAIARDGIGLNDGRGYTKHSRTEISGNTFGAQLTGLAAGTTYRYPAYVEDGTIQYGE